ncbi:glycoside hydrolase family 3 C-terminal domain-containing protein, partial [bacterium]|nr:glycoside hydrolase family 3 C-terminal domain-containing protein [bacterium]
PLNKNTRVLVTGPTADKLSYLNGGWTITWQGDREELYPHEKFTILQAIEQTIGKEYVTYVPGTEVTNEIDIQAAVKASIGKDVAIVCLGESTYCESPGNITDITLPEPQLLLTQALAGTGISVVIILVEGRPRIIKRIEGMAESIIMAYLPGLEGGRAISDVLFGDFNPCGKLPFTYPRNPNDLTLYDHKPSEHNGEHTYYNPQFPFGYGLSYTTFTYSDLQLEKQRITKGESLNVTVTVTNSGNRSGKEVIQLYLSDLYATVTPSVKKLKGFQKVELKPGESKTVNFTLTPKDLSFIGLENKPVIESGEFTVTISNLKANFFVQ